MGELVAFPRAGRPAGRPGRPPETVFEDRGWRILELPSVGRFVALSDYCRRGIEVGRFDPQADGTNAHQGTEIAILTGCAGDEPLSRCAIAWLNAGGPERAILGAFVIRAAGRYHFWRDVILEVAAIGGAKLVRLVDGSIAIAREPEPVPLLDPFAPIDENRHSRAFDRLPPEIRHAVLRWADPKGQFRERLDAIH